MNKKTPENYLGLARRAGKIVSGYRTCVHIIGKGSIKLMIIADDSSANTKEKFTALCGKYGVPCMIYGTTESLSRAAGLSGIGVFGITDRNFADVMIKEISDETIITE